MSLDDRACTYIIWTVKLDLGVLALVVIYGLVTVIHTKRIALGVVVRSGFSICEEIGEGCLGLRSRDVTKCDRLWIFRYGITIILVIY